jgi:serine phosphatase RsbU (regulator of sigma subunit)
MEFLITSLLIIALVISIYAIRVHLLLRKEKINTSNKAIELKDVQIQIGKFQQEFTRMSKENAVNEEKNKKLWSMSEEVYKEKKRVDEAIEKLEIEKKKVDEKVKKLWQQSTAIYSEKEKINLLKMEIEEKHKSIQDSIEYARVIQQAILPSISEIQKHFIDSFVFYRPRDIVSGDFYWFTQLSEYEVLIAAADCTGHGVPGAFMSMIGYTILNEIVNEKKIHEPSLILNFLNSSITQSLKQEEEHSKSRDGMDIAFCKFNLSTKVLTYAGANRPLYLIKSNGEFKEIKANKFPIGGMNLDFEKKFTSHQFQLEKNDCFYIFSDGYADQFGGVNGKKFMTPNFQKLLLSIYTNPMEYQLQSISSRFDEWKGNNEQVDDIMVIGVKV